MDDWIKIAREMDDEDAARRRREREESDAHRAEIRESEKTWMERVLKRLTEIQQQGIRIRAEKRPDGLLLSHRGQVEIQFVGHLNFAVRFLDVFRPSTLMLSRPINVRHHRFVRLQEMNEHNIEEILKFVSLGMDRYTDVATYERIERNLQHVLESSNQDERISGKP